MPDLEVNWARRLKRGARKEEVFRRIAEVASSCIRVMPLIKEGIDLYFNQFRTASPKKVRALKKAIQTECGSMEKEKREVCMEVEVVKKRKKKVLKKSSV